MTCSVPGPGVTRACEGAVYGLDGYSASRVSQKRPNPAQGINAKSGSFPAPSGLMIRPRMTFPSSQLGVNHMQCQPANPAFCEPAGLSKLQPGIRRQAISSCPNRSMVQSNTIVRGSKLANEQGSYPARSRHITTSSQLAPALLAVLTPAHLASVRVHQARRRATKQCTTSGSNHQPRPGLLFRNATRWTDLPYATNLRNATIISL